MDVVVSVGLSHGQPIETPPCLPPVVGGGLFSAGGGVLGGLGGRLVGRCCVRVGGRPFGAGDVGEPAPHLLDLGRGRGGGRAMEAGDDGEQAGGSRPEAVLLLDGGGPLELFEELAE